VRERDFEPAGRVADHRLRRRRHGHDFDRVVRKRRRVAVRHVGLIDEDDLHTPARDAEDGLERGPHALDNRRQVRRQQFFTLVRVDVEMRRANRPEAQSGIVPVGRDGRGRGRDNSQRRNSQRPTNAQRWQSKTLDKLNL
jgi:hypothetical protein